MVGMRMVCRSGNSIGRVPVFQTGCRGFDPHSLHEVLREVNQASVAQMAEQSFRKRQVAGSMPARGSWNESGA